jgi:hypothetical protein
LTGSVSGEGAYIYEKNNVKVTNPKSVAFHKAYLLYFPTTSYQEYNSSQIEMTDFLENSTKNILRKILSGVV